MNRTIKFRGLSVETREWKYGFFGRIQNDDSTYDCFIKEDTTRHISNVTQTNWQIDPITSGQYTGLYETYEGDILGIYRVGGDIEILGSIIYDPELAAFVVNQSNGGWEYLMNFFLKHTTAYVVGNVHENPDLL
jgi:uncharacterized phage protein (TIGR01671 family)